MKKLLLSALMLAAVGTNAQTVKKVILHDYTGVKCQFCTDGTVKIEGMIASNPNDFIPVQIHAGTYTPSNSPLKTTTGDALVAIVQPPGYPCGSVDMIKYGPAGSTGLAMSRTYWADAFQARKTNGATVSVGIDEKADMGNGKYSADINIKFESIPSGAGKFRVNVFILEDSIKAENGLEQINYGGGPYGGASPLTWATHKYVHNNVLRKALGGSWGFIDVVPENPTTDSVYSKTVEFTIDPSWEKKNLRIVAFVAKNGSGADKEIYNGEQITLNAFFAANVEKVKDVEILTAYPNPAKIGDVIRVGFDIAKTEQVTMNVYNAVGQKVATPYVSKDVKGSHTIQWKTGLDNLTPGLYFIEVATESGSQTQRIVLQ